MHLEWISSDVQKKKKRVDEKRFVNKLKKINYSLKLQEKHLKIRLLFEIKMVKLRHTNCLRNCRNMNLVL